MGHIHTDKCPYVLSQKDINHLMNLKVIARYENHQSYSFENIRIYHKSDHDQLGHEIVIMDVTENQTCEPNHLQNLKRQFNLWSD